MYNYKFFLQHYPILKWLLLLKFRTLRFVYSLKTGNDKKYTRRFQSSQNKSKKDFSKMHIKRRYSLVDKLEVHYLVSCFSLYYLISYFTSCFVYTQILSYILKHRKNVREICRLKLHTLGKRKLGKSKMAANFSWYKLWMQWINAT